MDAKLYEILMKLPKKNVINILWRALDIMQGYNGHTRLYCIVKAMGGGRGEDDRLSLDASLKEIKELTNDIGL